MALALRSRHRDPRVLRGYRRLLVPVVEGPVSERALELACRLASDSGSTVVAVAVVEVAPLLPLDAHMVDEERAAHELLERAGATADSYGVALAPRMLRARTAGEAIVRVARQESAELVVIGGPRRWTSSPGAAIFGGTVREVLGDAPCRVVVVAAPGPAAARRAA
jgi:nucleotide-binding universal stress UspA family protein